MAKVLFIDDEAVYYRMIIPAFKQQNHEVLYAKTGMDGLAQVPHYLPDVIISDVRLPDLSGFEVAERLRKDPRFNRIPIIFVTGQADLKDKLRAFELGADDYVVKPFQPEELVARLGTLLRRTDALKVVSNYEVDYKEMGTIIAVHSLRGGVGCSTIAVNLALALQHLWAKRTLLVDANLIAGQISLMINAGPVVTWENFVGLKAMHIDDDVTQKLMQKHQAGIHFVASSATPLAADSFADDFWATIIDRFMQMNDFMVFDTSHDLNNNTIQVLDAATQILLVVTPEMASLRSAISTLAIYEKLGIPQNRIFIVVNQTFEQGAIKQSQVEKVLRRPVNMIIPYVPAEFVRSINIGEPYILRNPDSPITGLFEDAAYWLSNDIHKNIPPVAPTATWKKVNTRLQAQKV